MELVARYEAALRRTARRYSLNAEDAEDAYQRALEILLTKAPTTDPRELIRWTQTVTKHEALAVRESRERLLGYRPTYQESDRDPIAEIPVAGDGPDEQAVRRERVARSREALRALKPAELRALTLLAEGYSYAEISEITSFSATKVNRLLAEGRERFRNIFNSSEDGTRCAELRPLLSAFCDGEASPSEADVVREHLRACAHCRATLRAYRAAPRVALGLAPALASPSLLERALERARDLFTDITPQVASPAGAKLAVGCLAIAGGAGLATGVVPTPLEEETQSVAPRVRSLSPTAPQETRAPEQPSSRQRTKPAAEEEQHPAPAPVPPVEEVEYEAPSEPAPAPEPTPEAASAPSPSAGSAAGEFGP